MPVASRLRGILALVRVPNLFTAPPDVLLGAALASTVAGRASVPPIPIVGACLASVLLYAAGTTLNDYADAGADATDRPDRPIPSGVVAQRTALAIGVALLIAGPVVAVAAAGRWAGIVAVVLAAGIAAYDGGLKDTPLGSPTMGAIRGTNLLLGVVAVATPGALAWDVTGWTILVPVAAILVYITTVTHMAKSETSVGAYEPVLLAGAGTIFAGGVGIVALLGWLGANPSPLERVASGLILTGFLLWAGSALRGALADPRPGTIGPAVGTCVLGLVVFDAAIAATIGLGWAGIILAFLVPAVGLSRVFEVS